MQNEHTLNSRPATVEDLDAVSDIVRQAIDAMEAQGIHQWDDLYPTRDDLSDDIRAGQMTLVLLNDIPAAFYVLNQDADEEYDRTAWTHPTETACILHRLCVDPAFQGQGVATAIMEQIRCRQKELGFRSIRLDVFTQNPAALRLYRQAGFQERGYADWRMGRFLLMESEL